MYRCRKKKSFDKIKRIIARDTLLIYPYFNKRFDVHADASDFQLGSVFSQDYKPIDSYSRKLTIPQSQYTVKYK